MFGTASDSLSGVTQCLLLANLSMIMPSSTKWLLWNSRAVDSVYKAYTFRDNVWPVWLTQFTYAFKLSAFWIILQVLMSPRIVKKWLNLIKHQEGAQSLQNPKRHIPPVSLLLWRKITAIHCFVLALGLQLWSVRQWDKILIFGDFKKILYLATSKRFRVFKDVFHVRWTNIIP